MVQQSKNCLIYYLLLYLLFIYLVSFFVYLTKSNSGLFYQLRCYIQPLLTAVPVIYLVSFFNLFNESNSGLSYQLGCYIQLLHTAAPVIYLVSFLLYLTKSNSGLSYQLSSDAIYDTTFFIFLYIQLCFSCGSPHHMLSMWPIIPNRHHGWDAVDGFAGPKSVSGRSNSLGWNTHARHYSVPWRTRKKGERRRKTRPPKKADELKNAHAKRGGKKNGGGIYYTKI